MIVYRHKERWYSIELIKDLFGDLVVVDRWGGAGKKASGARRRAVTTCGEARAIIRQTQKTRRAHGYRRVRRW